MKPIVSNDRTQNLGPHPEDAALFETRAQARAPYTRLMSTDIIHTMEALH